MKTIALFFITLFSVGLNNYSIAQVDDKINFDSLLQKSDAVVLDEVVEVNIESESSAEYFISEKILIKNNKADKYCKVILSESHFREVYDIEAKILSVTGEEIKELDSDEIREAEFSPQAFYSGNNYKFFELSNTTYPFIFEYKYKSKISTLLFWPDWHPQSDIPTIKSSYKLTIDPKVKFRYYKKGITIEPSINHNESLDSYRWSLEKIPASLDEDYLSPEDETQTALYFVPQSFTTDNYTGNTESWDAFSNWYRSLAADRYTLPNEAKKEIKELVKDASDVKEKIKILYKYLQKKNRYVAIEMGLAGWQPQSATQVYTNRYGDCKDLSTFMVAMLNAIGIRAYPALALTKNKGNVNPDEPSYQFNHCIVMVPLENDSIWLECTSTYDDMGEMNYNIEDMYALVVGEKNGSLIKTPQKKSYQNKWHSNIDATIALGDLNFSTRIFVEGNTRDYLRYNMARSNSKDDVLFLTDLLGENYSNLNIEKYNLSDQEIEEQDFVLTLNGTYTKFLPSDGIRLFLNPSIFNRKTPEDLPKEEVSKRKYPVYFSYPYLNTDTVNITVPKNYTLEAKPTNQLIDNDLINYKTEYDLKNNKLFFVRTFELKKNYITLQEYPLFYETTKKIIELDKAKFVLKKN